MKALVLHGPGDLRLEEVPKPVASPGSIVVRVIASPLWDYVSNVVDGSMKFPHAYPLIFGTCCVGRIDEVGDDAASLEPGQLVFCDHIVYARDAPAHRIVLGYHGGHSVQERKLSSGGWKHGCWAEYARIPAENAHVVDEELMAQRSVTPAQLTEISSVMSAIGAANSIQVRAGETVIVMPATESFSSSAIVAALGLGANVVAVSRSKDKLDAMINHFGEDGKRIVSVTLTDHVAQDSAALRAATPGGRGADAYIDFSSNGPAQGSHIQAGLLALKRHGRSVTPSSKHKRAKGLTMFMCRCCLAGAVPENVPLPYLTIRVNCLTIRGSFAQVREDVECTIRLIEAGNLKLRKIVAGEFSLKDHAPAMQLAKECAGWEQMVLIKP
ncbi:hypothetical protein MMC17_009835 [Xylographa soralifera]|nr:hypothetical protein [Xylographa soralifera]